MSPELDPSAQAGDDLSIRGDIGSSSVPELFRSLLASGETGILTFRNGEVTKKIHILDGRVVFAASTNPDERLGENLLFRGKIGARQFLEAAKMIRPGRKLGGILVELNALESEELTPAVEQQMKDIILDLLTWSYGDYELVIKDLDPSDHVAVPLSTENLILEGVRRCKAWSHVLKGIGSIENVLVPVSNTEVLFKLELTPEEQEVLAHVNGRSTVEQICQVSYLSNFETCRILWAFLVLGLVRREQKGEAITSGEGVRERERELDLEGVVEKFNQMFGTIYSFLKGRIGDQVDTFMDGALEEVSRQYGALYAGVDLKQYGRADYEQMLANVADLPPEQRKSLMVAGLNELVFVIQLAVRTQRGAQEEAVVSGIIKEGFRRLGAA